MNNGQILYLYDAKMCNPNGDPDEENRPRMDYERDLNLVSDLRLKRYIRDYCLLQNMGLYVQKIDDKPVTSEDRLADFWKDEKHLDFDKILDAFIDIRMFGATVTAKDNNQSFTGPIQFNWGYSLNKVALQESSITSHFASKSGNQQGAIGKDYRVRYSLIAFSGVISGHRAGKTHLKDGDIDVLDQAMVNAIPLLATRSKIGQYPRFYLRVELKDDQSVLRDLRSYIKLEDDSDGLRDISECVLDVTALDAYLHQKKDIIQSIHYYTDDALKLKSGGQETTAEALLAGFQTVRLS